MPKPVHVPRGHEFELGPYRGRRVRVHVPGGGPPGQRRGALLLFDGQNAFGDAGSFAGGWHAHRAVDHLAVRKTIPAPVVVAIDHTGAGRIGELAPFDHAHHPAGLAPLLDLVQHEILRDLHARVPVREGPDGHVIGGSSMGGLAALYAHFARPEVFGGALVMSPSLWFGSGRIFDFVAAQPNPYRSRVYLDCGAREGRGRMLAAAERMAAHLRGRGWAERKAPRGELGLYLLWRPDARGGHDERSWRRRLPRALRFLF